MKTTLTFKTKKEHRVCIHLKPKHFTFLKHLANRQFQGNISKTILYLLSKYLKYLYRIKKSDIKRTLTIDYQPKTKEYKRYWIPIQPTFWGELYHLRGSLGYSMSFLLRIMLDWEMEETQQPDVEIIIPRPNITEPPQHPHLLHNYAQSVRLYHVSRWVFLYLSGYA